RTRPSCAIEPARAAAPAPARLPPPRPPDAAQRHKWEFHGQCLPDNAGPPRAAGTPGPLHFPAAFETASVEVDHSSFSKTTATTTCPLCGQTAVATLNRLLATRNELLSQIRSQQVTNLHQQLLFCRQHIWFRF